MEVVQAVFLLEQKAVNSTTNVDDVYGELAGKILRSFVGYEKKGSGWIVKSVDKLDITLSKLNPLRGGSYIVLPECIRKKEAIIIMRMTNVLNGMLLGRFTPLKKGTGKKIKF